MAANTLTLPCPLVHVGGAPVLVARVAVERPDSPAAHGMQALRCQVKQLVQIVGGSWQGSSWLAR